MSSYYNNNVGVDLISVDEILSSYLWDQKTPPAPAELNDAKWILPAGAKGTALTIDMQDYMTKGAGRFVSAADFKFFEDFFEKNDIPPGHYNFADMWQRLKNTEYDDNYVKNIFKTDVYQYTTGIGSPDYVTRAFIFGSTKFTVDLGSLVFSVDQNGNKEIQNLKIIPVDDDFDFKGGTWYANAFNTIAEDNIDPSGIGRKVPIRFTGDVPPITVNQSFFNQLIAEKTN